MMGRWVAFPCIEQWCGGGNGGGDHGLNTGCICLEATGSRNLVGACNSGLISISHDMDHVVGGLLSHDINVHFKPSLGIKDVVFHCNQQIMAFLFCVAGQSDRNEEVVGAILFSQEKSIDKTDLFHISFVVNQYVKDCI